MQENEIAINDLYSAVLPVQKTMQNPGDVHFTEAGYEFLGKKVAGHVLEVFRMRTKQ